MRIARVLHASSPFPIVALERDGALYGVADLELVFGAKYLPDSFTGTADFHTRVVALCCAGLAELDDRLLAGDRPTEARLAPNSFVWLAPCATERAAYIQMAEHESEPTYWLGNARGFVGHDANIPFPAREEEPDFELCLAAILRDDLRRASYQEARRAILGYSILNGWTARSEERVAKSHGLSTMRARDFAPQLGPLLITPEELTELDALRAQARVGAEVLRCSRTDAGPFDIAESIAYASDHIELYAGDVVGSTPIPGGSCVAHKRSLSYGSVVELTIERLGKLVGRPVRGPEATDWRRYSSPNAPSTRD